MNWLIVILIVAAIAGLIGYFYSDKNKGENAAKVAIMGGLGCGYIILQIFPSCGICTPALLYY